MATTGDTKTISESKESPMHSTVKNSPNPQNTPSQPWNMDAIQESFDQAFDQEVKNVDELKSQAKKK